MSRVLAVAVREFLVTVRTKAFILTVVLMPALIIGATLGGQWVHEVSRDERVPTRHLAVVDHSEQVFDALSGQVQQHNTERPNQPFELHAVAPDSDAATADALAARVRSGELYGYLVLAPDVLTPPGGGDDGERGENILARRDNQLESGRALEHMVNEAVYAVRCQNHGIDPLLVVQLRQPVQFQRVDAKTGGAVSSNEFARILTPFAFMFLLFMGTFGISQGLLTTLIEEKSSRIVEVLLAAVSPTQLLAGKIIGMAAVGFLLIVVWGAAGYASAQQYDLSDVVTPYRLVFAVLYFIPGFLLISSLMAGIGSACNELKEAQSMVFPLSILTIIPMIFWFYLSEHPASMISVVLSHVPPITPFVMILRICADPDTPVWQIVSTLALLWVSVAVAIWAAGKVFRVGVLMYGKPPSLRELLRWVRYS